MVSRLYEHLSEGARHIMTASLQERAAFIAAPRWIGTDAAREAHEKMQALLNRPKLIRTKGVALVGPFFNGKTLIAERFLLQHLKTASKQRVWVVQTREGAGLVNFLSGIVKDMRAPDPPRSTVAQLTEQVDVLFRRLEPRLLIFDEFHNALRGRSKDVESIFAFLRRLGRLYDISPVLIGEVSVYDHVNATTEMSSRIKTVAVPRWQYDESYLSLLDTLEAAMPLANPSDLSSERLARHIFAMAEGLIGETVDIIAEAAIAAINTGKERITIKTLDSLKHVPASQRRRSPLRAALI